MSFFIAPLTAFIITLISTPLTKKVAFRIGAVDKPNERKVHTQIMPRLGGLAIFLGFSFAYVIFVPISQLMIAIYLGTLIIVLTGIFDDIYNLSAKTKFAGQTVAALVVVFMGLKSELEHALFNGNSFLLEVISTVVIVFWIVGVTNAVNLIDGLDGLASGVSVVALIFIFILSLLLGTTYTSVVSLILLGSTLAFLIFNFHPAKIYMGDTGSLFLGYTLGVLTLLEFNHITYVPFIIPVLILGVPVLDTLFAILRRLINKQNIFAPDKNHLHHCLLNLGLSVRRSVIVIYIISSFFGLVAIGVAFAEIWLSTLILLILLSIVLVGAYRIGLIGQFKRKLIFNEIKKNIGL